jgi:anti-anti-sigma regulatory factor
MSVVRQADPRVFELVEYPTDESVTWVRVLTGLDLQSAWAARDQLTAHCSAGPVGRWLVVELDPTCFIDLRGLPMLVELGRTWQQRGGSVLVVSPLRGVALVLRILHPDPGLTLVRTAQDAWREVRRGGR